MNAPEWKCMNVSCLVMSPYIWWPQSCKKSPVLCQGQYTYFPKPNIDSWKTNGFWFGIWEAVSRNPDHDCQITQKNLGQDCTVFTELPI
jgi:hypothetical protein